MSADWLKSVDRHRESFEEWASSDLPLSDDIAELLEQADGLGVTAG